MLDNEGLVRNDRDLVFYNAPRHITQAVTLDQDPAPGTARLSVSLPRTETEVQRIVVSASVTDATFTAVGETQVTVYAADGPVAVYTVTDTDSVSTLMFGEFYRRDGGWRFRAIGQGWATGMAGLITEFGIQVDDDGATPAVSRAPAVRRRTLSEAAAGSDDTSTALLTRHVGAPHEGTESVDDHPAGTPLGAEPPDDPAGPSRYPTTVHPGNAHYRLDEAPDATHIQPPPAARVSTPNTASRDPFTEPLPTRQARGTVTLRRLRGPEPAPPAAGPADWYNDPDNPDQMRWWDGAQWTSEAIPSVDRRAHHCHRCGARLRRRIFGGHHPCAPCAQHTEEFLRHWHTQATRVLTASGPQGAEWDALWSSVRYQRIPESEAYAVLAPMAAQYVERRAAFAFADGQITAEEYEQFEHAIQALRVSGPQIEELRARMTRERTLSGLREGDLPTIQVPDLHLDAEELVYLDTGATHIRELARGPKYTDGRLIVSTKKLRFVGAGTGVEIPWSRIVSVAAEYETVVVSATSARGGATFAVSDPDHVSALLEGALRIAKRLVLAPGQRDSRSISQEVKAEVWQRDGGRCVQCGESHYLEFDHIIPLSRGGATSATNLQILCRGCNREKGANI